MTGAAENRKPVDLANANSTGFFLEVISATQERPGPGLH